ncbi:hypothetical protein MMC25_000380 [Agyrium rufum]|nr:hypothetical protein [Agyrium rufum]
MTPASAAPHSPSANREADIQILVHVAAPGRSRDDARYRALAKSVLGFEAATHFDLAPTTAESTCDDDDDNYDYDGDLSQRPVYASIRTHTAPRPVPAGLQAEYQSAPYSISSGEPDLDDDDYEHGTSFLVPRTANDQSSGILSFSSARSTVENRLLVTPRQRTRSAPVSVVKNSFIERPALEQRAVSDSWETPPSVVPDSQPTPKRKPCWRDEIDGELHRRGGDGVFEDRPKKRLRLDPDAGDVPAKPANEDHALNVRQRSPAKIRLEPASQDSTRSTSLIQRFVARGPAPPVSDQPFVTHVTPSLEFLAQNLSIAKRFRPAEILSPLEDLQRGYWELRVSRDAWSMQLREKFWNYLAEYIGAGKAGWGVWAEILMGNGINIERRDTVDRDRSKGSGQQGGVHHFAGQNGIDSDGDWIVRVWCWGEVVGHIYLLLFLASERKVKGMAATWKDAAGETMVRME